MPRSQIKAILCCLNSPHSRHCRCLPLSPAASLSFLVNDANLPWEALSSSGELFFPVTHFVFPRCLCAPGGNSACSLEGRGCLHIHQWQVGHYLCFLPCLLLVRRRCCPSLPRKTCSTAKERPAKVMDSILHFYCVFCNRNYRMIYV